MNASFAVEDDHLMRPLGYHLSFDDNSWRWGIVFPLAHSSLKQHLAKPTKKHLQKPTDALLKPIHFVRCMLDVSLGLSAFTSNGWVHSDVKPSNILIFHDDTSANPSEIFRAKLADFGLSKRLESGRVPQQTEGTPKYIAPEVVRRD